MYNLYALIDFKSTYMKMAMSEFRNSEGKILLKMNSIAGFEYFEYMLVLFTECL